MSETFVQKKFSVIGIEINDSRTYGIYAGAWSFAVRQTHHNIFKEEAEETSEEETTAEGLSDEIREKMAVKEALANADTDITEDQWNLSAMHWSEDLQGSDQIRIALLDSGVSYDSDVDVAEDIRILEEDQDGRFSLYRRERARNRDGRSDCGKE